MDILRSDSANGNLTPEKRCTGPCGRTLPATPEFFHRHYGKLQSQCKECRNKAGKAYYSQPEVKERHRAWQQAYDNRPGGKEYKQALGKAYRSRPEIQEYERTRRKAYRSRPGMREREQAYVKAYRSQPGTRERYQNYQKNYYSKPENQEHRRAHVRDYMSRPGVREDRLARKRVYYRRPENHERYRTYVIAYRARKKAVAGTHTSQQIAEQLKRQRYRCYYMACGHARFEKRKGKYIYHIDHVVPLSRGGSNDISNIVLTCPHCNLSKNDRLPHEFWEGGRLL